MAELLELKGQFRLELVEPVLIGQILHGRSDEALGDFERGFDLDAGRGAGIDDGDDPGEKRCDKVDGTYRDEKLSPDRPVVPKLLQHASIVSHRLPLRPLRVPQKPSPRRKGRKSNAKPGNRITKCSRPIL